MANKNHRRCACGSGKPTQLCCGHLSPSNNSPLTPNQKLILRQQVEALSRAGHHLDACAILQQLLSASPQNPLIWNDLAIQYHAAGYTDRALEALRRGHLCDPTYPPILYNLGLFTLETFLHLHNSAEHQHLLATAAAYFNANLDRDPSNADAHHHLALIYTLTHDEPRAQAHHALALRIRQQAATPPHWRLP